MAPAGVPQQVRRLFEADPRVVEVVHYTDGFVANRYHWPAPGRRVHYRRRPGNRHIYRHSESRYDRKRRYGRGSPFVAFSARGGRLASA